MKIELNKVYRARNGTEWKIVCRALNHFVLVNKDQFNYSIVHHNGRYGEEGDEDHQDDLIELVGDDFELDEKIKKEIERTEE